MSERKSSQTEPSKNKALSTMDMEIQDLLADVNEFIWLYHGRPQWVLNKLRFCAYTLVQEDIDQTKTLLEKAPDLEPLAKFRQQVGALPASVDNNQRLMHIDRAIENVTKVKNVLTDLITRVLAELKKQKSKR